VQQSQVHDMIARIRRATSGHVDYRESNDADDYESEWIKYNLSILLVLYSYIS
jgi:hypothetical protein